MRQKSGAYLSTLSTTALPKDSPPPLVCKSPRRRGAEGKKNREEEERSERIFSVWLVRVCIKGEGGGRGGGEGGRHFTKWKSGKFSALAVADKSHRKCGGKRRRRGRI